MQKLLLMVVAVVLVGCGAVKATHIKKNNANLASLTIGMTKAQVLGIMGPPKTTEAYETNSGGSLEYFMYETDYSQGPLAVDAIVTRITPVCIIDGKLKGWGRNFYDDTIKIRKEIIKK